MKTLVWIVSGLAAFVFVSTGLPKVTASAAELTTMYEGIPVVLLKIAGVAEVLGGLGLIIPAATRILPILTPVAAGGLVLTMLGAIITNIAIGEYTPILISLPYLVAAAAILWARSTRYAIASRKKTAAQPPAS
ncbi:DoxX family protein [Nonomuraea sp. NPDC005983]|uniref:DoxX family protein n=1 Tax=Nonomuraea sp. NPDC005983 TaxID=3155595 RepID=UPI0033BD2D03